MPDDSILSQTGGLFANQQGPFSSIIQSGLVPGTQQQQQPISGLMGTGGRLAYLGDKLLEGFQKGRMLAYMGQEAKKQANFKGQLAKVEAQLNQPGLTQEQTGQLQQLRANLFSSYWTAMNEPDKKTGKSRVVPDDERPKYPAGKAQLGLSSKKDEFGTSIEHLKEAVGGMFRRLAGPNLPKSGSVDSNDVDAQLKRIGAPSLNDNVRNYQDNIRTAMQVMDQDADKNGRPHPSTEEYIANPVIGKQIDYLNQLAVSTRQPEGSFLPSTFRTAITKQQRNAQEAQDIKLQQERQDWKIEQQISTINQPSGSLTSVPLPGGVSIPVPSGPPAILQPPEQLSPKEIAANQFNNGPGFSGMFGKPVQGMTERYLATHNAKPIYITAPGEKEATALLSLGNGVILQPGTNRVFNTKKAMQDGWKFEDARPVAMPAPNIKPGWDADHKHIIQYIVDRNDPTHWTPVLDKNGKPVLAGNDKDDRAELNRTFSQIDDVVKTRDSEINRVTARMNTALNSLSASGSASFEPDEAKRKAKAAQITNTAQRDISTVNSQANAKLNLLGSMSGHQNYTSTAENKDDDLTPPPGDGDAQPGVIASWGSIIK